MVVRWRWWWWWLNGASGCACVEFRACALAPAVPVGCTPRSARPTCLPALPPPPPRTAWPLQFCTLSTGGDHSFWSSKEVPVYGTEAEFTASGERHE